MLGLAYTESNSSIVWVYGKAAGLLRNGPVDILVEITCATFYMFLLVKLLWSNDCGIRQQQS